MKKILLASTALVATAGIAAAGEVGIKTDGYFGAAYGEGIYANGATGEDQDYAFVMDLDFNLWGESTTDSGLTFGGSVDVDDAGGSQGALGISDGSVFVSSETLGTLEMGDIDSGAEAAYGGDLGQVSLTGLGDADDMVYVYTSGANAGALYTYENSGFNLAFSLSDDEHYAVGAGYDGGMWGAGIGYENTKAAQNGNAIEVIDSDFGDIYGRAFNDISQIIGGAHVKFSGVTLKGVYGVIDTDGGDYEQYGISAKYGFDAWTLAGYWRTLEAPTGTYFTDDDFTTVSNFTGGDIEVYGIGAAYDLGGGAALKAGLASLDGDTVADFGMSFAF